jgi:hypothetical protein
MTHQEIIKFAFDKGYRFNFENNTLDSPFKAKHTPKIYGNQRYPSYTVAIEKKIRKSFYIHKFVAYQLFGEKAFEKGIQVRHLDRNVLNLSKENITLGTSSENQLDKPKEVRVNAARKARMSQKNSMNQLLEKEQILDIIIKYEKAKQGSKKVYNGFFIELQKTYPIKIGALEMIARGRSCRSIYNEYKGIL